ncbi:hypothetical protein M407DRAFT_9364 [Tulasnella calospora MUT 4182]|uniref:F-box domain-containing protein n=1 Tax=Tulasnella calospora MUT 4182 TaxID=1051891 RepID=A0A0C3QDB9_9AGAM|nr:hypothetical protein M407DRAFT_9364 [Tulasnella calospora MUT 4182]
MDTLGQIAEIIDVILSFTSRSSLYNCALVCKSYHDIAIKYLWRTIPSAWPLLSFLGIVCPEFDIDGITWRFSTTPSQSSWESFDKFAKYVEVIARRTSSGPRGTMDYRFGPSDLGYDGIEEEDGFTDRCCGRDCIDRVTLNQITQHQYSAGGALRTPLIPNLERLDFTFSQFRAPPETFVPFLGPKLKKLTLSYHSCMRISDQYLILLQRLIRQGLQELAKFESEIPLENLEISVQASNYSAMRYQEINEAILLVLERYTKLRRLKAPTFLRHDGLVSGLRHLSHLQSLSVTFKNPEVLMSFLKSFCPEHPNIRHLELEHENDIATPRSILDPLLDCHGLISLSITTYLAGRTSRPSNWPLPDVHMMSEAWPQLELLTLCPWGIIPLEDLEAFQDTELFPHLKSLEPHHRRSRSSSACGRSGRSKPSPSPIFTGKMTFQH